MEEFNRRVHSAVNDRNQSRVCGFNNCSGGAFDICQARNGLETRIFLLLITLLLPV
jgi:hypothetical protein